ncbi:LamG-like jellyroll fold domain-containing protein [Paraburkholderia caffeinilytica]|uniref:LamG-like jellyroll fold domain-containing protein n=1 Tax=Paraburkholderia caffeinilytica TaxID=1761016 RepID=UPI003DA1B73D
MPTRIADGVSRRTFLYSLGALALSACGGGEGSSSSQSTQSSTSQAAATSSSSSSAFVHPGLLHTQADFDRMSQKVAAQASPWIDSWNILIANSHASLSWTPNPQAVVSRGDDGTDSNNAGTLYNDIAAAYACALRWKITGTTAYADKAVQIMNAWSSTLTKIGGTTGANSDYDGILLAGIQGYQFANAGEIMRTYSGWTAADFASFQSMMLNIFYPVNHGALPGALVVYSNWDLCCVASIMAIGVLCDNQSVFDEAVTYFKTGLGNGAIAQTLYYLHPGYLGQTQESGRDQGHDTLSIAHLGAICQMAWNQSVDLFSYNNNSLLAAAEYVAKGNLIQSGTTYYTIPFATYTNASVTDTAFSTSAQGTIRPCWTLIYHHYVNLQGIAAPYTGKMMTFVGTEGGGGNYGPNTGGYDQLGYGTLTCTRDPIGSGVAPSGLTAFVSEGSVTLSWWGTAYATSYNVQRSTTSGGSYTTIATGITDLLTYTDSGLAAGTYYYVVSAETPTGETAVSNEAAAVTAVQLQTYLTFNASSGTTAADSSGNGHTGTLVGGASWVAGKTGNAVSLDGSTGYVSLPSDIVLGLADFTIAAWVNCSTSRNWMRVFDFGSNVDHYMMLTTHSSSGVPRFAMTVNGSAGEKGINGTTALPTGEWTHIAVTLSGSVGTLYVNGSAVGTNTAMLLAPFRLGSTSQNWIGHSQYSTDPYFHGLIDEFRIYYNALTADQIATLAAA